MNADEFREFGKAAVEYIAEYHENIRERPVLPSVEPGYMKSLIPESIPEDPDHWKDVLEDMERVIMPGLTHWQSPQFHCYYPTSTCFPSIVGEMMSAGLGVLGFTWISSPACTELELIMMDWLAKAMDLPEEFYNSSHGTGGGMIQTSASDATFFALLIAKERTVRLIREQYPELQVQDIKSKLVAYTSDQSNCSVEKAGLLASVPMRLLPTDKTGRLRGDTVKTAIEEDRRNGLIPCYVCASFGTTVACAFDAVEEIGPICKEEDIWLHVDGAYAGAALICPELRGDMQGMNYVDSLVVNVNKWLAVNFDCSAMWFRDTMDVDAFKVESVYMKQTKGSEFKELRHFQIALGRRFRSLKLWFTLRLYGLSGLQGRVRSHVTQAKKIEKQLLEDSRFMLACPTSMGLLCIRLKGDNSLTNRLLDKLTMRRKVYLSSSVFNDVFFLRLVLCNSLTDEDIKTTVTEIKSAADEIVNPIILSNNSINDMKLFNGQLAEDGIIKDGIILKSFIKS